MKSFLKRLKNKVLTLFVTIKRRKYEIGITCRCFQLIVLFMAGLLCYYCNNIILGTYFMIGFAFTLATRIEEISCVLWGLIGLIKGKAIDEKRTIDFLLSVFKHEMTILEILSLFTIKTIIWLL